jgi:hypothetical protein
MTCRLHKDLDDQKDCTVCQEKCRMLQNSYFNEEMDRLKRLEKGESK